MEPLISWLTGLGAEVYLIQLSGHLEAGIPINKVSADLWKDEMLAGYTLAKQAAKESSLPLYFLGYSLGALLAQSMILLNQSGPAFDKQVLLAPAMAIRSRAYLLRLFFPLSTQIKLPSFTPKAYRANAALPLLIYKILFAEERKLWSARFKGLNIPTLVIIDPKDELISYRKLIQLTSMFKLTRYQILELKKELKHKKDDYHHLILSEETMSAANWQKVAKAMGHFFTDNHD
jgi:alpha-beta hydrolase superfamily lysophospholipase